MLPKVAVSAPIEEVAMPARHAAVIALFTATAAAPAGSAAADDAPVTATVAQIQGAAHRSPLEGEQVRDVTGVVTAVGPNGLWFQSDRPDRRPATSEGLYVYTGSAPTQHAGDRVSVAGTVTEFRPGGSSGTTNLTTTELTSPTITVTGSGAALPDPVVLGVDRVAPQQRVRAGSPGDVEAGAAGFDPRRNALDFDESLEGMRVGVRNARAVGPTNTAYGELPVVPGQRVQATRSSDGGVVYGSYRRPNAMRVILDDPLLPAGELPVAAVGDRLPGTSVGVLDYSFGNPKLLLTQTPSHRPSGLQRESTSAARPGELSVATFNVENLAPADPASKYQRLATQIARNLRSPDVLALEEIQDDSGDEDDGVVSSGTTVAKLTAAIRAAGGPRYEARSVDPANDEDGGEPGGNIRQVFLYRTDRGVGFTDRAGGDATTATQVVGRGTGTTLSASPGRIDPTNAAWKDSRKPLVGQFTFRGRSYFVIANHFASKGGDQPLFGRWQPPQRSSEVQRHQQASVVRGFVDRLLRADPRANVVTLGDLNDFEFSRTADILVGSGRTRLTDLPRTLPASERFTYVYDGNSQVLDHILVSPALQQRGHRYDIVHTNSGFPDQDSDHDPQVVRLSSR